jgi:hypothetical protein
MGDIKITNLHEIHETEETKDKYQIFHTEEGRVYQSMVLYRSELEQLGDEVMRALLSTKIGTETAAAAADGGADT